MSMEGVAIKFDQIFIFLSWNDSKQTWGCRGPDRMVVGFITIYAISAYQQ